MELVRTTGVVKPLFCKNCFPKLQRPVGISAGFGAGRICLNLGTVKTPFTSTKHIRSTFKSGVTTFLRESGGLDYMVEMCPDIMKYPPE